ncbi:MAG: hypothetical protein LBO63_05870 [Oscillospiraceae bacterium]|jgi:hypothetical protein|nr:hypothetical protein [Oscillospiraceae bacterium]
MNKAAKIISIGIYSVGAAIVVFFAARALFGSAQVIDPNAMLTITYREQAFMILAFGAIPMILSCLAVYNFGGVKLSRHRVRNAVFVFLPGVICGGCALYIIVLLAVGYIRQIFFR